MDVVVVSIQRAAESASDQIWVVEVNGLDPCFAGTGRAKSLDRFELVASRGPVVEVALSPRHAPVGAILAWQEQVCSEPSLVALVIPCTAAQDQARVVHGEG